MKDIPVNFSFSARCQFSELGLGLTQLILTKYNCHQQKQQELITISWKINSSPNSVTLGFKHEGID